MGTEQQEELDYWERLFTKEDPWGYSSPYEQTKYRHTLEILPDGPLRRAVEIGCAEGMFTELLAGRVDKLLAVDISSRAVERARNRCRSLPNVTFQSGDMTDLRLREPVDLITCSEVLYYLQDRFALSDFARRLSTMIIPGGHLVMAHANMVADDRSVTGFDFNEIGAKFIGETFAAIPAFEFLRELRTALYRVQLFRRRLAPFPPDQEICPLPREVLERQSAPFEHPMLKRGGCVVTDAEARFCFETPDVPILMYHRVAADGPAGLRPYRIEPDVLDRQLSYLHRFGYRTATVDEIWHAKVSGLPVPGRVVALTFDDGYQDFAEVAWPLLRRYGFTATVYLVTGHVGGRAEWDSQFGEPAPLMDWQTVRALAREGICFGAHSSTHPRLTTVNREQLAQELTAPREAFIEHLGKPPLGFCYPFSDHSADVRSAVEQSGYDHAVAGEVPRDAPRNRFLLPRTEILGGDSFDAFLAKLPEPNPSSAERRSEYARLRLLRDRRTYFDPNWVSSN
jgi:peptidoglycan/xylan/chitin deacetylase (PgdA/CDA1 family)